MALICYAFICYEWHQSVFIDIEALTITGCPKSLLGCASQPLSILNPWLGKFVFFVLDITFVFPSKSIPKSLFVELCIASSCALCDLTGTVGCHCESAYTDGSRLSHWPLTLAHCFKIADYWHCCTQILAFLLPELVIWHARRLHFRIPGDSETILGHQGSQERML